MTFKRSKLPKAIEKILFTHSGRNILNHVTYIFFSCYSQKLNKSNKHGVSNRSGAGEEIGRKKKVRGTIIRECRVRAVY